jgi:CubicO group peptidase (beta-lactamase class C family)
MVRRAVGVALVTAALSTSEFAGAQVAPAATPGPLEGVWASETTFGPTLRGQLRVSRGDSTWRAVIASAETRFRVRGDSIRFSFGAGLGEFRGRMETKGRTIDGFWIQPGGVVLPYPFATPLRLDAMQPGVWQGTVVPLDDAFSLYLVVWRNDAGELVGSFRNPERNSRGRASQFRVNRLADSVVFTARPDTTEPEVRYAAAFDSVAGRLVISWPIFPELKQPFVLRRISEDQAVGLYPRVPRGLEYAYRVPDPDNDGWIVAPARTVGFDEAALARLVQRIADTLPNFPRSPFIHSLLIARHGKLVLEEYFFGHDRERTHDTRSAAKTFASVMLGAVMRQGVPIAPETAVSPLILRGKAVANPDSRKQRITLAHLMTHTSGLACDDNADASPGNEDAMQTQRTQPDYWQYVLDLPMAHDPGSRYAYCSGGTNLVGGALTRATARWLPDLFNRTIARPLQFGRYYYNLTPTLDGYLGGGVFMRPRDLLKVGQVYLDGGVWHGRRLVDASWVTRSTSRQMEISEATTGLDSTQFPEFYNKAWDGYAWHLSELQSENRTYREYEASGNGGQLLMVVPELDLVVVFTAGNYMFGGIWQRFRDVLLANVIIPALRKSPAPNKNKGRG